MSDGRQEAQGNGSPDTNGALEQMAAAVADQTPVEWGAERARAPELSAAIDRLREIEALHAAHLHFLRDVAHEQATPSLFSWGSLQAIEGIGQGSFAEVFRAWDPMLEREVALKLRRGELGPAGIAERRWIEEARQLARVRHPNVLLVYGAEVREGRAGIWTELVRGQTLEDWLATRGPLGAREAAVLGMDLCGALEAVHAVGLVHGDVTTRNVMREGSADFPDGSGRIVLMDFGSAHEAGTPGLVAFGTPAFMAPEVLDGEAPSVRSDVYSLGIVLYRMVSGRYPVELTSVAGIRQQLREARVPLRQWRPDLRGDFVHAVELACAIDPGQRFASPAAFERALAGTLSSASGTTGVRSLAGARLAVLLLVVLVGAFLAFALFPRKTRDGAPRLTQSPASSATGGEAGPAAVAAPSDPRPAPAPEVEATLYRMTAGTREVVRTGDLVAPGDGLGLEVRTESRAHFYVLSEDRRGDVHLLFPLRHHGSANPLTPGVAHWLPGEEKGDRLEWRVTSAGGKETLLLLASGEPLPSMEQTAARLPEASPDAAVAYPSLSSQALSQLRGIGGLGTQTPLQPEPSRGMLASLSHELSRSKSGERLWMRLVVLENPIP